MFLKKFASPAGRYVCPFSHCPSQYSMNKSLIIIIIIILYSNNNNNNNNNYLFTELFYNVSLLSDDASDLLKNKRMVSSLYKCPQRRRLIQDSIRTTFHINRQSLLLATGKTNKLNLAYLRKCFLWKN